MVGDFRASLYDLFGYLFPGLVAATGLALLWHVVFATTAPIPLSPLTSPIVGSSALVVAYLVGHLCHAIGNMFPTSLEDELLKSGGQSSLGLLKAIDDRLSKRHGVVASTLRPVEKYGILDEEGMFQGERGDRDVYIYREGFYRGMVVASAILLCVVVFHLRLDRTCFSLGTSTTCLSGWEFFGIGVLSAAYAWASLARTRRFARYRVERAAFRWLAATAAPQNSPKPKPVPGTEAAEDNE
jgi:hypothetical protein